MDTRSAQAHLGIGDVYAALGKDDDAVHSYRTALGITPNFTQVHYALGNLYLGQQKVAEAIAEFQAAVSLHADMAKTSADLDLMSMQAECLSIVDDDEEPVHRKPRQDSVPYERSSDELRELKKKIDVRSVMPELVAFAQEFHSLRLDGSKHLPQERPSLIVSNHVVGRAIFTGKTYVMEDLLLTLNLLFTHLGRPIREVGDSMKYEGPLQQGTQETFEKLGCVPVTLGNGIRLLEMGETVLIYPEGRRSRAPYQTRPYHNLIEP